MGSLPLPFMCPQELPKGGVLAVETNIHALTHPADGLILAVEASVHLIEAGDQLILDLLSGIACRLVEARLQRIGQPLYRSVSFGLHGGDSLEREGSCLNDTPAEGVCHTALRQHRNRPLESAPAAPGRLRPVGGTERHGETKCGDRTGGGGGGEGGRPGAR